MNSFKGIHLAVKRIPQHRWGRFRGWFPCRNLWRSTLQEEAIHRCDGYADTKHIIEGNFPLDRALSVTFLYTYRPQTTQPRPLRLPILLAANRFEQLRQTTLPANPSIHSALIGQQSTKNQCSQTRVSCLSYYLKSFLPPFERPNEIINPEHTLDATDILQ